MALRSATSPNVPVHACNIRIHCPHPAIREVGSAPTAEGMVQKGQSEDKSCRMGCRAIEDMHHIFVVCPVYTKLRKEAETEVTKRTRARIQSFEIEETCHASLLRKAKSLFTDCNFTWPLHYSFYYLGHTPPLDSDVLPSSRSAPTPRPRSESRPI